MQRREFMTGVAAMAASTMFGAPPKPPKNEWRAFSRVFQKFGCERAATLLSEAGYTGVEWTVRPGGFVRPDHVADDLPKAISAAKQHKLDFETVVVGFLDPYEGNNLDLLKIASEHGVKSFRPGYFRYSFEECAKDGLDRIRRGFDKLEKASRETGLRCLYQNHSTYNHKIPLFGSLVWDLWEVIKDRDPDFIGVQYDVMHARAESGPSWRQGIGLLAPWIRTLCLKDFKFAEDPARPGDWKRILLPAGEGIVAWKEFLTVCRREGVSAPYSVHFDYAFPENDYAQALQCAKKDLDFFKGVLI
jgi:L-ribulose-5-phosphate 3-epimerase